jgi:hypothetical protein
MKNARFDSERDADKNAAIRKRMGTQAAAL